MNDLQTGLSTIPDYTGSYFYTFMWLIGGIVFVLVVLGLARLIAPHRPSRVKNEAYESGEVAVGQAWVQFPVHFYIFALVYVVFDVEAIFVLAWAMIYEKLAFAGFLAMTSFLLILFLGLLYAWRKGVLKWL